MCSKFFFCYLSDDIIEWFFIFIYFFAWRWRCILHRSIPYSYSCFRCRFWSSRWLLWIHHGKQCFKHLMEFYLITWWLNVYLSSWYFLIVLKEGVLCKKDMMWYKILVFLKQNNFQDKYLLQFWAKVFIFYMTLILVTNAIQ